jgi:hypothetical protein
MEFYLNRISDKKITLEQLPGIFLESPEYQQIQNKKDEFDINFFEKKIYSQNGEDGILEFIFDFIGTTNKYFVEIGVEESLECNTRLLQEKGWDGIMIDGNANSPLIKKEFVTAENINAILKNYLVPNNFDLLSLDVDYNTYWIWKAIENYQPRVVVIEYNATISMDKTWMVKYDPLGKWDGTNYFGASLLALKKLGDAKGYSLIGCDSMGVNAFFIKKDLVPKNFRKKNIKDLFKPPKFGKKINGKYMGHVHSDKIMEEIFTQIYHSNAWEGISRSGTGSDLEQTKSIREELPKLLKELKVKTLLDLPCGDFYWMKEVNLENTKYIGGDIVQDIIDINNKKYSNQNRNFIKLDITKDPLLKVDLILCRYLLQHLSESKIWKALENIKKSNSKYLLTTVATGVKENIDINDGEYRPLNLLIPPFSFPEPQKIIDEKCTVPNCNDMKLFLWKISEL